MIWIENALHPFMQYFHSELEIFGVGLASSSIYCVFWFYRHGATSLFLVHSGCKIAKKNSLIDQFGAGLTPGKS
jgi:hypothetical protein